MRRFNRGLDYRRAFALMLTASLSLTACGAGVPTIAAEPSSTAVAGAPTQGPAAPEATPGPTQGAGAATQGSPASDGVMRLRLAPDGNEVRYRVREQLASLDFPSDAVGSTADVSGTLLIDEHGAIVGDESRFVVDLTTLRSDENRRDRYIQDRTLETGRYPTSEFVPREVEGLPDPLPTEGQFSFQVSGDMIIHGVIRPLTWDVDAEVVDGALVGTAMVSFPFSTFDMQVPRVMVVLSVEDNIRLEYDFRLIPES